MRQESKIWGVGRIEVIRVWDMVERMLEEGHSVSSIHRSLQEKNVVSITRRQFDRIIRQYKQRYKVSKLSISPSQPASQPPRERLTAPLAYEGRGAVSSTSKPQTFQHDPRPSKDYFAKGAGS